MSKDSPQPHCGWAGGLIVYFKAKLAAIQGSLFLSRPFVNRMNQYRIVRSTGFIKNLGGIPNLSIMAVLVLKIIGF